MDVPILDRSTLEYHLDTLTSRSQELDFEIFARHLAQREICPNLIHPTGPSGGGDGKVDSETYPVSEEVSLTWITGIGTQAASEKWAFAFSAKADWAPKLRSDIKKLVGTGRGYKKAFFMTNQYVSNKKRSEAQDKLSKEHALEVVILDRTWILDRVFESKHELMAIEDLKISAEIRPLIRKGPQDLTNEQLLEDLETRISTTLTTGMHTPTLAMDCLEAAIHARNLERPRAEVEGLFDRAERVAAKHGTAHQCLQCAYERAFTAHWWHEDYDEFLRFYEQVECMAKDSDNAHDLELLSTLWHLLYVVVARRMIESEMAKITEKTLTLKCALDKSSSQSGRPSNSLQARTMRLMMDVISAPPKEVINALLKLQEIVRQSEGLVGYPFEKISTVLIELGAAFNDMPEYCALFETVVETASKRKGEVSAARMLLKGGTQQLDNGRPYEAIRLLGRCLNRLFKHESRQDLLHALYACSEAYKCVGLLWAARGTLLTATSLSTQDLLKQNANTRSQIMCFREMKWLELHLGRIVQTLIWSDMERISCSMLASAADEQERIEQDAKNYDCALGVLLLRSDCAQLDRLSSLPDRLAESDLIFSSSALLFALGHEEPMAEWSLPEGVTDLNAFFSLWCKHLSSFTLPCSPVLGDGTDIQLVSHVLGCAFLLKCPNASPFLELGESVLAALESLLATGIADRIYANDDHMAINIRAGYEGHNYFEYAINDDDECLRFDITCGQFDTNSLASAAQQELKDKILGLLVSVLARAFVLGEDPSDASLRLIGDDRALERALNFTSSFVTIGNVLGHSRQTDISLICENSKKYQVHRSVPWAPDLDRGQVVSVEHDIPRTLDQVDESEISPTPDILRHTDVITISLFKDALWAQAGWSGVAFGMDLHDSRVPVLALYSQNRVAAEKIFHHLIALLGHEDKMECLRVSIVTGIDDDIPTAYSVVVGANPSSYLNRTQAKLAFVKSRHIVMEPKSDRLLDMFLKEYRRAGQYLFSYAYDMDEGQRVCIDPLAIRKRELYVRRASDIGENDVDIVAIHSRDKPFISKTTR